MNADLDALATRLYVTIDDLLKDHPNWRPERPEIGITPTLTDAELVTLAVIQALLGYTSERRFIRYAHAHLRPWFPSLPQRAAYNKRLRAAAATMQHIISRPRPRTARATPTTCGSSTPPRSNAAAPEKPSNDPTWPDTPATDTALHTHGSSGDYASTSSRHPPGSPSHTP